MVLLTRSLCRLARTPAATRSLFTIARSSPVSNTVLSRGTPLAALRSSYLQHNNHIGSIRTLTGKREKVKVLLVLYDGKKHAEEVRSVFILFS